MKILIVLCLSIAIAVLLNYIFEMVVFRGKGREKASEAEEEYHIMERGINGGCQTSIRMLAFSLIGLFISLAVVGNTNL